MMGKINWTPTKKDMLNFGMVILIGFGIIGALLYMKGKTNVAIGIWSGATAVFLLAALIPSAANPFYVLWMGFGMVMGFIMSRIVLTLIFYVVLTPVALIFRLMNRDALRKKTRQESTYWVEHPVIEDKSYYEHLF
jgi:hypothetical protein